ncbi:MAG TPA: hypoxanthine phosphoribosyltransferase [Bacteroidaceae bacterium]|nr:hypoxanthine phosphoribosyltransferase [Bacteroidaceae bacterium]
MNSIQVKDKKFEILIAESQIKRKIKQLAGEINRDMKGMNPFFLGILNGSFMFASDLLKEITIPCQISFMKLASYQGMASTGVIKEVIGLSESIKGRHVIVIEDIIDSGFTMRNTLENLGTREPASISVCSLLLKPGKLEVELDIKYLAFSIPDDFIVGYGLDYCGFGRNTKDIYSVIE